MLNSEKTRCTLLYKRQEYVLCEDKKKSIYLKFSKDTFKAFIKRIGICTMRRKNNLCCKLL